MYSLMFPNREKMVRSAVLMGRLKNLFRLLLKWFSNCNFWCGSQWLYMENAIRY